LSITDFGNHGYPYAIKSIHEEKNSLSLRQFFFVFQFNFILFGGTQREESNQDKRQKLCKQTEQPINDLWLSGYGKNSKRLKLCIRKKTNAGQ